MEVYVGVCPGQRLCLAMHWISISVSLVAEVMPALFALQLVVVFEVLGDLLRFLFSTVIELFLALF